MCCPKIELETKTLFAAIVGLPNVGKSTILNRLVGAKIAIATPKPQTTRNRIMGVLTAGLSQYVFLDTPGFHIPKTKLGERMVQSVRDSYSDVDVALFVVFPKSGLDETEQKLLQEIRKNKTPAVLVLNKADTISSKAKAQTMLNELAAPHDFANAVAVSALTGDGFGELMTILDSYAVVGPHMFDEDTLTDMPEKVIVAELIREKLLFELRDELPHGCAVAVESFKEREGSDLVDIEAVILCEKQSHKGMVIGKGGQMLKKIGSLARKDIEQFLDCRVNLKLWVKVRENWRNNESRIRDFGY